MVGRWFGGVLGSGLWLLSGVSPAAALPPLEGEDYRLEFYGSARVQVETVRPDNRREMGSYTGFRDAYSRVGVSGDYLLSPEVTVFGQLELPLDLVNWEIQDPFDHSQDVRVAKIGARGDFGSFSYGKMWMPYYNAIAYPVDMFSSYYSGFATFTTFRLSNTISYYSPEFSGFSFALGWSHDNGDGNSDRFQATGSYSVADTTLAVGVDRLRKDWRIWGISLAHTWQQFYVGAKLEIHDSDIAGGYGADGDSAINLLVAYTLGQNTLKAMLAEVDRYGEEVVHLGVDHQFNDSLLFFAEYYWERESAAITAKRDSGEGTWGSNFSGGQVFLVGARFDF
ncbi:MAG: porin [Desulfurivibrio sp.]